jgi:predicted MPP superfamily phosphohydrolase
MKRVDVDKDIIDEIDSEERKEKTKALIKKILWIVIPILLFALIAFVSLRYIGNYGIVVKERAIYSNKINDDLHGLKIVHFSDIYYSEYTEMKQIDKLVNRINYTNPDIVIFTGDLISKNYILSHDEEENLVNKLSSINASIGKIAIKGEIDEGSFDSIMDESGFEIYDENEVNRIFVKNSYFNIANFDENMSQDFGDDEILNIVLTHNPDSIDTILDKSSPDIILAGHTLNGQVRLPLIGGLFRNSKYMDDYYEMGKTKVLICGGTGNKKLNIRLFNNPSINFIRLRKEAK